MVPESIQHRFKAVWVGALAKRGFHLCSMYLIDSEGLSDGNAFILSEAAKFLQGLSGPWILTGDFNMSPEDIAATDWVKQCYATVVAPTLPACFSHTYDYFVVSQGLAPSVLGAARVDGGFTPHYPR